MPEPMPDNGAAAGTVVQDEKPMSLEAAFDQDEPVELEPVAGGAEPQPAKPGPPPPPEAKPSELAAPIAGQPPAEGAFDPASLGLSEEEAAKLRGSKTPAEALAKLAESYRNLHATMGRQAEELHAARAARERPAEAATPPAEAPAQPTDDGLAREYARLAAWRQADPDAANAWLQEQLDTHPLDTLDFLTRGAVALATQNMRTGAPDAESVSIQVELATFRGAHADHARYEPVMRRVAARLPTCPTYDELYAMAKVPPADLEAAIPLMVLDLAQPLTFAEASELAKAEESQRKDILDLMGSGMAYGPAKELRELRAKKTEYEQGAADRAKARVNAAKPVASGGGARGGGIPIAQMPHSLEEAFDEDEET